VETLMYSLYKHAYLACKKFTSFIPESRHKLSRKY